MKHVLLRGTAEVRRSILPRAAMLCLVAAGLALAAVKAANAPITTDEAWSWNEWISAGAGRVWSDYSAANNHIFHNLLVRVACILLGSGELSLRLVSLGGWMLFLLSSFVLINRSIQSPVVRVCCMAALALHPYLVDFAALARGYSLMLGFLAAGACLLDSGVKSVGTQRAGSGRPEPGVFFAGASVLFGLAMGTVPIGIYGAGALVITWTCIHYRALSAFGVFKSAALILLPAGIVTAAVYYHAFGQLSADTFYYGADSLPQSLRSLYETLIYVPQAAVDRLGNPLPVNTSGFHSWKQLLIPPKLYTVLYSPVSIAVFSLLAAAGLVAGLFRPKDNGRIDVRPAAAAAIITVDFLLLGSVAAGTRLPLGRTWLVAVPFLVIGVFCGADYLLRRSGKKFRPAAVILLSAVFGVLMVNWISTFDMKTYREWPDNSVVPSVIRHIEKTNPSMNVTAGYPWYQNACFVYYTDRASQTRLRPAPGHRAENPCWDYILFNAWNMEPALYAGYRTDLEFPAYNMKLLKIQTSEGLLENRTAKR
ncbi:MAG: hypothetical protein R6V03_03610 [Kiritimatiellia bacterium]